MTTTPKVSLRVAPDQLAALDELAKANGETRSDIINRAIGTYLQARGEDIPDEARLSEQRVTQLTEELSKTQQRFSDMRNAISRQGNLLNQIARVAHTQGLEPVHVVEANNIAHNTQTLVSSELSAILKDVYAARKGFTS